MGEMADLIADSWNYWGNDDCEYEPEIVCKYCRQGGLFWTYIMGHGWRLADEKGFVHKCSQYVKPK